MKKSQELLNNFETVKLEANALVAAGKGTEALAKLEEAKELKAAYEAQLVLEELEENDPENKSDNSKGKTGDTYEDRVALVNANPAKTIRAMVKKATGRKLTEAEDALLLPSTGAPNGDNGEGYILPKDIKTLIVKKVRDAGSIRSVVGYLPTTALSGSFPTESFETVTELFDFVDGTDGQEADDIEWINVNFKLKEKGALIKLSNTLLKMTDNNLIDYVATIFARKAVVTENKLALAAMKLGKTTKTLTDIDGLRKSINVDLDPAVLYNTVIVTNQDGFEAMDGAKDSVGRPILEQDSQVPTRKLFKGHPIVVFSNGYLPTRVDGANKFAPVVYGNLDEAIKLVEQEQYSVAFSSEAGFTSNSTIGRIIEFVDVVQADKSDKCYIYGEFKVA